jgi:hypothetical protein
MSHGLGDLVLERSNGAGLRASEVVLLKITDIARASQVIQIDVTSKINRRSGFLWITYIVNICQVISMHMHLYFVL